MIKDSGERKEFETGAVRDMHEGKGRCDLLPACAILRLARHYEPGKRKLHNKFILPQRNDWSEWI